jgi:hypothetical protein
VAQLLRQRLLGKERDAGEVGRERRVQATCARQRLTATRPRAGEDTQDMQDMPDMHDVPATGIAKAHAMWPSDAALPLTIWPIYEGGEETLGGRGSGEDTRGGGGEVHGEGNGRGASVALVGEEERAYIYAAAAHAAASFRAGEGEGGGWGREGRGGGQDASVLMGVEGHWGRRTWVESGNDGLQAERGDSGGVIAVGGGGGGGGRGRAHALVGAAARRLEGPRTSGASGGAAVGGQARWSGDAIAALDMLRVVRSGSTGGSGRSILGHGGGVGGGEGGSVTHSEMTLVLMRLQAAAHPGFLFFSVQCSGWYAGARKRGKGEKKRGRGEGKGGGEGGEKERMNERGGESDLVTTYVSMPTSWLSSC